MPDILLHCSLTMISKNLHCPAVFLNIFYAIIYK